MTSHKLQETKGDREEERGEREEREREGEREKRERKEKQLTRIFVVHVINYMNNKYSSQLD